MNTKQKNLLFDNHAIKPIFIKEAMWKYMQQMRCTGQSQPTNYCIRTKLIIFPFLQRLT